DTGGHLVQAASLVSDSGVAAFVPLGMGAAEPRTDSDVEDNEVEVKGNSMGSIIGIETGSRDSASTCGISRGLVGVEARS
ncbi:hypothetical protein BGW38_004864, partial [Lunasporangiospora selenospora]